MYYAYVRIYNKPIVRNEHCHKVNKDKNLQATHTSTETYVSSYIALGWIAIFLCILYYFVSVYNSKLSRSLGVRLAFSMGKVV